MTNETSANEIYGDGIELTTPRAAKGGTFAPADMRLIKDALTFYIKHNDAITTAYEHQAVNLIHRVGRIG